MVNSDISGIHFHSAGIKLTIKLGNFGIKMGVRISERGIGSFQLRTSGLADTEFSAFSMKLGR